MFNGTPTQNFWSKQCHQLSKMTAIRLQLLTKSGYKQNTALIIMSPLQLG